MHDRAQSRQQAAEDLLFVIEHFADKSGCPDDRTLLRVFAGQREIVGEQVTVRKNWNKLRVAASQKIRALARSLESGGVEQTGQRADFEFVGISV